MTEGGERVRLFAAFRHHRIPKVAFGHHNLLSVLFPCSARVRGVILAGVRARRSIPRTSRSSWYVTVDAFASTLT